MRRGWVKDASVCVASALAVVTVYAWMVRPVIHRHLTTCLDQTIPQFTLDLTSLPHSLESLQKATGVTIEINQRQFAPRNRGENEPRTLQLSNLSLTALWS